MVNLIERTLDRLKLDLVFSSFPTVFISAPPLNGHTMMKPLVSFLYRRRNWPPLFYIPFMTSFAGKEKKCPKSFHRGDLRHQMGRQNRQLGPLLMKTHYDH